MTPFRRRRKSSRSARKLKEEGAERSRRRRAMKALSLTGRKPSREIACRQRCRIYGQEAAAKRRLINTRESRNQKKSGRECERGLKMRRKSGCEKYSQMPAAFRSKSTWGNAGKGSPGGGGASVGWLDDAAVRQRTNEMKWYENETKWNEMERNEMKSFTVRISCTSTRAECDSSVDSTHTHTQTDMEAKPTRAASQTQWQSHWQSDSLYPHPHPNPSQPPSGTCNNF